MVSLEIIILVICLHLMNRSILKLSKRVGEIEESLIHSNESGKEA